MNNLIPNFLGVVLAGGKSSRMGIDKTTLKINEISMLDRTVSLLKECGARHVVVSKNDFSKNSLPDIYPGQGPLSGIHSALFHTELPLLVAPVDMPLLNQAMLQDLMRIGLTTNSAITFEGHNLPLFVPNNVRTRSTTEKILTHSTEVKSISNFLSQINYKQLVVEELSTLVNTNTPQQWQQILALFEPSQEEGYHPVSRRM